MDKTKGNLMHLKKGKPNPQGAEGAQLYYLEGDAVSAPVESISILPGAPLPPRRNDLQGFHLKIAHLNDLHGHIDAKDGAPLFGRAVSALRRLRADCQQDPNSACLLLAAGDDLIGTIYEELLLSPLLEPSHPTYSVYAEVGIDACCVGNHELDPGLQVFTGMIARQAVFPVLSANLRIDAEVAGKPYPAAILVVNGLRVGLIGLTTPAECRIFDNPGFVIADPVQTCLNLLPALRPLCDVVIVLSHLGLNLQTKTAVVEVAGDMELAAQIPPGMVDLIVGGHTHTALNVDGMQTENIVNGIPIVQAGAFGQWLGEVELTFDGKFELTAACLHDIEQLPLDVDFDKRVVDPLRTKLEPLRRRVLGVTAQHADVTSEAINSSFASEESALANMISDALVACCRLQGYAVDCAMIDRTCIMAGLEPGAQLTFEDWFNVMPYLDNIQLYTLSGAALLALLQDNAGRLLPPGSQEQMTGFAHFSQEIRYTIETNRTRTATCATKMTFEGVELMHLLERVFTVATTSFFRGLCGFWEKNAGNTGNSKIINTKENNWPVTCIPLYVREELTNHLENHGGATLQAGLRRDGRLIVASLKSNQNNIK